MCKNEKCELKELCLRFVGTPNKFSQSYLCDPEEYCENKNHELFIDAYEWTE